MYLHVYCTLYQVGIIGSCKVLLSFSLWPLGLSSNYVDNTHSIFKLTFPGGVVIEDGPPHNLTLVISLSSSGILDLFWPSVVRLFPPYDHTN